MILAKFVLLISLLCVISSLIALKTSTSFISLSIFSIVGAVLSILFITNVVVDKLPNASLA